MVGSRAFSGSTIRLMVPPLPAPSWSLEDAAQTGVLDPVLHLHQALAAASRALRSYQLGRSDVNVLHVDRIVSILLHGAPLLVGVARDMFPAPPLPMRRVMQAKPPSVNRPRVIDCRCSRGLP